MYVTYYDDDFNIHVIVHPNMRFIKFQMLLYGFVESFTLKTQRIRDIHMYGMRIVEHRQYN